MAAELAAWAVDSGTGVGSLPLVDHEMEGHLAADGRRTTTLRAGKPPEGLRSAYRGAMLHCGAVGKAAEPQAVPERNMIAAVAVAGLVDGDA